jgi:phage regulator Rha-like protein
MIAPTLQSNRDAIAVQQAKYARQSAFYREQSKLNRPFSLTIRQTQILMNKYSTEKAMKIASRYNSIMQWVR